MLIQILLEKNVSLSKLCDIIQIYPQILLNAKVDNNKKNIFETDKDIQNKINEVEQELLNDGRVVIRPSGTEPLIRVMLEGKDQAFITKKAKEIVELIEKKLK